MHKSRLGEITIDCKTDDLEAAVQFWSAVLGQPIERQDYGFRLGGGPNDVQINVQAVDHESRVHLDLETDDIEAEVKRLEQLGATRVRRGARWWVMEAPTGHRFCVCNPQRSEFAAEAKVWES